MLIMQLEFAIEVINRNKLYAAICFGYYLIREMKENKDRLVIFGLY